MKRFLTLFLAIVLVLSLASCLNQKADPPTPTPDGDGGTTTTTTTTTTTQKDNTPKQPLGYSVSEGSNEPPTAISFSSIKEIQDYITAATGTEEEFDKYHAEKIAPLLGITYEASQAVAHNLGLVKLPMITSATKLDGFGARYNLTSNRFDITYRINDIRYQFVYRFNESTLPLVETPLVKENVSLASYTIDLYERESGGLLGYFLENSVRVSVIIHTEDFESASLDSFNTAPIASIK